MWSARRTNLSFLNKLRWYCGQAQKDMAKSEIINNRTSFLKTKINI